MSGNLGIVNLDLGDNPAYTLVVKWSHLGTFIVCHARFDVHCADKVLANDEYGLSHLLIALSRVSGALALSNKEDVTARSTIAEVNVKFPKRGTATPLPFLSSLAT